MAEAGSLVEFSRQFDAELTRLATQDVSATACTMRSNSVSSYSVSCGDRIVMHSGPRRRIARRGRAIRTMRTAAVVQRFV
jgi:hypothetical protein